MMLDGDLVVDGRVDYAKLLELLAVGTELEALEFKSTLNLRDSKHRTEIVKDLLALMSLPSGGYYVVGVDNHGRPAFDHAPIDGALFDQAALQQSISAFVDARIDVRSATHDVELDGQRRTVALIFAGPPPEHVPLVVRRQGEYSKQGGGQRVVFSVGQVLIREGTTTAPLAARHWPRLLARFEERVRSDARRDIDALVARVVEMMGQSESGGTVVAPIDFRMDGATFKAAVDTIIESGRLSRLDDVMTTAWAELHMERHGDTALARVFAIAVSSMLYGTDVQFHRVLEVVGRYYDAVPAIGDSVRNTSPSERSSARIWRDVAVYLYLLGAEAVVRSKWDHLRRLTLHPYDMTENYGYVSWIRHAVTSASRAEVLDSEDNTPPGDKPRAETAAMISRALDAAFRHPELTPDLPVTSVDSDSTFENNALLDALCQFDILWCLIAFSEGQQSHHFFPSGTAFSQRHAHSALLRLVTDDDMRSRLFPGKTDDEIANAIDVVMETARYQSQLTRGYRSWDNLPDRVARWTKEHNSSP